MSLDSPQHGAGPRAFVLRLLAFAVALGVTGCGTPSSTPPAGSDAGIQGCEVRLSYRPANSANSVGVVGEWNGFDRTVHRMTDPSATGTYAIALELLPGEYAYAFLVNGAEQLDPESPRTVVKQGRTWSVLTVGDCRGPSLKLTGVSNQRPAAGQGTYVAEFELLAGLRQTGASRVEATILEPGVRAQAQYAPRALGDAEIQLSGDGKRATVTVSGLADGKYTLQVWAASGEFAGAKILLPFWIEEEPFSFEDGAMYMIMTDRFRNGNPANDGPARPAAVPVSASFQGGDLEGVAAALREGYFDALGVRSLWLTPWQTQPAGGYPDNLAGREVAGYHGYWPVKAREVDPRLGGARALHDVVEEAHKRGIRVVMDTVLNHVHEEHEYFVDPARRDWFRVGRLCSEDNNSLWDREPLTCLFTRYMPDIDWTVGAAAEQFIADTVWWVEEFDLDGLRIDAVKHVEEEAIEKLATRMRQRFEAGGTDFYMFGETFTGDHGTIKRYIGPNRLDGQLNFPLFMANCQFNGEWKSCSPEAVFAKDEAGLRDWNGAMLGNLESFGDALMVTFVGNHDVSRFITNADEANRDRAGSKWDDLPGAPVGQRPYDRLWLAMLNLLTTPGVPLVYYGDEYGEHGGADPDNRHMARFGSALGLEQQSQLARMRKLGQARRDLRGLSRGPMQTLWVNDFGWGYGAGTLYAYARPDPDPREGAVVVLNLDYEPWNDPGIGGAGVAFPPSLGWQDGQTVRDLLSGWEGVIAGGAVRLEIPARGGVILALK